MAAFWEKLLRQFERELNVYFAKQLWFPTDKKLLNFVETTDDQTLLQISKLQQFEGLAFERVKTVFILRLKDRLQAQQQRDQKTKSQLKACLWIVLTIVVLSLLFSFFFSNPIIHLISVLVMFIAIIVGLIVFVLVLEYSAHGHV